MEFPDTIKTTKTCRLFTANDFCRDAILDLGNCSKPPQRATGVNKTLVTAGLVIVFILLVIDIV